MLQFFSLGLSEKKELYVQHILIEKVKTLKGEGTKYLFFFGIRESQDDF
jgi:hypothetical protein